MTLEESILQSSPVKEAKLYGPSQKAIENPSNGITVNIPAAANVIHDCAVIAHSYIPHYVFGMYANPFSVLNKQITLDQIKDFVNRASTDMVTNQLLQLVLSRGASQVVLPTTTQPSNDDPYGDYIVDNAPQQQHDNVYILSKLFGVI